MYGSLCLYLSYDLPLCKVLHHYINKYGYYKYFPISPDFSIEFLLFYPKIANLGSIQIGIMANIISVITNYHYAKFHAFIRKWTIDVIFYWL